jgi:nucleotide-binding universal stress UspA family protein
MTSTLFSTILCPVDFSDYSFRTLRYATGLARHLGAHVAVLHVANPLLVQAAAAAYDVAAMNRDTARELRALADAVSRESGAVAAEIRTTSRVGDPATEIVKYGEEVDADLIVMGTHGRSGYRRTFFGSVTEQVLRRSSVPVLAVPPSSDERSAAMVKAFHGVGEAVATSDVIDPVTKE